MKRSAFHFGLSALIIWALWSPTTSRGQTAEIDSLERTAAAASDTLRIDALIQLGRRLRNVSPNRAVAALETARDEAETSGYSLRQIRAANSLGVTHGMQGDYAAALEQFKLGLRLHQEGGNLLGMAESYNNLGIVYKSIGDYPRSYDYYLQALQLYDSLDDQSGRAACFNNIGILHDLMEEPERSLTFYRQALEISESLREETSVSFLLHNIGLVYGKQEKYEESLEYLFKSLEMSGKLNDQVRVATALTSIGNVYFSSGAYERAADYFLQGLEKSRALQLKEPAAQALYQLASIYLRRDQPAQALQLAEEHLRLSDETGSLTLRRKAHELLAEIHARHGRFEPAFKHSRAAADLQDSLFNQDKTQAFQQWQTRLDVYEKDRQISEQALQLDWLNTRRRLDRRLNLALALALLLAMISSTLFYQRYRMRQRTNQALSEKNQRIEAQKKEIEKINAELEKRMLRAQINPHFIFNSLSSIQHFITANDRPAALKYLSKFSSLLRQVLEDSISNQVILAEEIQLLHIYLDLEALRFDQGFSYEIEIDPELDPYTAEVPVLLLQPFVENAILHGLLPKPGERKLRIAFADQDGYLCCRITDNGVGREAAARLNAEKMGKRPSRGMEVTQKRLEALNRHRDAQTLVSINDRYHPDGSAAGTEVIVQIPKP